MTFHLTITRHDGRELTEELDTATELRDLTATVVGVIANRPRTQFYDFATSVVTAKYGTDVTHEETQLTFNVTRNEEN